MLSIAHLSSTAYIAVFLLAALFALSKTSSLHIHPYFSRATMASQGWYSRTSPLPAGTSCEPSRSNLLLVLKRSTPVAPNGFSLALLAPDVAIDALGRVLHVEPADHDGIVALARATLKLPDTNAPDNLWRVAHRATGRPIERVRVAEEAQGPLRHTSVYGFAKSHRALAEPVGEHTVLPDALFELLGLAEEAREGYRRGEEDAAMVSAIRSFLEGDT